MKAIVESDISAAERGHLTQLALPHYTAELPYHNAGHATDVMNMVNYLASMSNNDSVAGSRNLLTVAAAWHDADHHLPFPDGQFDTKELRSMALMEKELSGEVSSRQLALLTSAVLDTTVEKTEKSSPFGVALHFADLGYFMMPFPHFTERLQRMHAEWEVLRPQEKQSQAATVERTRVFGKQLIAEAEKDMPSFLPDNKVMELTDRIRSNIQKLDLEAATNPHLLDSRQ